MNRTLNILILASLFLAGCKHRDGDPDVSDVKLKLTFERFDKALFEIDSNRVAEQLPSLLQKYPAFTPIFLQQELNLQRGADTPAVVIRELRVFLTQNMNLNLRDSVEKMFGSMDDLHSELEKYFRYVKYYYPDYAVPTIIPFIGNFGNKELYTQDGLGIQLNFYLGASFSYYQLPEVQEIYASFLSRKFSREYIPVDCMAAIVDDMYPPNSDTMPLIDQIIDRGKRLYVEDKFLPGVHDTLTLGYTNKQYEWCKANEGLIWSFLVRQNILYTFDPDIIKNYLTDAPFTQNMPEQSPGSIGSFVGLQIVRSYLARNGGDMAPKKLMEIPVKTILSAAQYNPK